MGKQKKLLDFDKNELFVSSRICNFILDNALKTNLSESLQGLSTDFVEKHDLRRKENFQFPFSVLAELIDICRKANSSNEQFYTFGNLNHELHILVSSVYNFQGPYPFDWRKELNFVRIILESSSNNISVHIELHQILQLEYKSLMVPILKILNGFFERVYSLFFNKKPIVEETKNSLIFTYSKTEVSQFDFVRFISNEQLIFSRINSFVSEEQVESMTDKISFFLFKDIGFSIEEIGLKLNISVRSLQRKLSKEGSSFRSIKEKLRKELAVKYLEDESLLIHDICLLLAYSERSAFEKAFKKWYGVNPSEYKKGLR